MKTHRSTTLRLFDRHCPRALGFHEEGAPRDRDLFAAGIAAHAMLQACVTDATAMGRTLTLDECERVCERVLRVLVSEGRSFDGVPEPPLAPTRVAEGRDIVMAYLERRPWDEGSLPLPDALVEAGLAMDAEGNAAKYGSGAARYQAAIDALDVYEGDDGTEWGGTVKTATVWEYKSAWPTNAAELDTLQTRGHAVLVAAHHPDAEVIQRNVVNLRTGAIFTREMDLDDEGHQKLRRWRSDIFAACDAADRTRTARPGAGCDGCPWVTRCEDALTAWDTDAPEDITDAQRMARSYVVAKAVADYLAKKLRGTTKVSQIEMPDGALVGYEDKLSRTPAPNAHRELAAHWFMVAPSDMEAWSADNAEWLSLLSAHGVSTTGIRKAAKAMYPERDSKEARAELENEVTEEVVKATFGIYRT